MKRVIQYLEKGEINFYSCFLAFSAVIGVRFFLENLLVYGEKTEPWKNGVEFFGLFIFFLTSFVIFLGLLKYLLPKEELGKLANILLWGQWVIILPPFVDFFFFGRGQYLSFYVFDGVVGIFKRYFLFFGDQLSMGITLGVRVEIFILLVLLGFYLYAKDSGWLKILKGLWLFYTVFYILGVFPSLVALVVEFFARQNISDLHSADVAKMFFSPFSYFSIVRQDWGNLLHYRMILIYNLTLFVFLVGFQYWQSKDRFWALLKNIRLPQMIFNWGLFFFGLGLGTWSFRQNLTQDFFSFLVLANLMLAIFCAWFFSVFINDLVDEKIDRITNVSRPLVRGVFDKQSYQKYAWVFFFFSLITSLAVHIKFFILILIYHALTWVYSAFPFRLKRFIGIASLLSSLASLLFLFLGYMLLANNQSLGLFPWRIGIFLFIAYMLIIPLKDLKDIEGDVKDGVLTLPVLLGQEKTRLVLGSLVLINYLMAVFVINEKRLFFVALLCGSISFWVINNQKNTRDKLLLKVLFAVMLFLILAVGII